MEEIQEEPAQKPKADDNVSQLQALRRMKKEIEEDSLQDEQIEIHSAPGKKIKPNEEIEVKIHFDLCFDDDGEDEE